jgi:hypothetical protein
VLRIGVLDCGCVQRLWRMPRVIPRVIFCRFAKLRKGTHWCDAMSWRLRLHALDFMRISTVGADASVLRLKM